MQVASQGPQTVPSFCFLRRRPDENSNSLFHLKYESRRMPQQRRADQVPDTDTGKPPLVFLGPTLPQLEAMALLPASVWAPARRGDFYRALAEGYKTIVLIDGEFHGTPAVWQREIADALAEGTIVHGASSMGAIRAAELHRFGMIGHGKIFEWYRDGVIDADDEVALAYGPPERGYPAMSEPLVNIRATLQSVPPEVISPRERDQLVEFITGLYFFDRSFAALFERGPARDWPVDRQHRLAQFVQQGRIDQKREDAVAALTAVATNSFERCPPQYEADSGRLWRRERLVIEGLLPEWEVEDARIAQQAGLTASEVTALRHELSALSFVALWGRAHGILPTGADLALERDRFPDAGGIPLARLNGLLATRALANASILAYSAAEEMRDPKAAARAIIQDWIQENAIESPPLQGEALVNWVIDASPGHFGYIWDFAIEMIETLWISGRVARFWLRETV